MLEASGIPVRWQASRLAASRLAGCQSSRLAGQQVGRTSGGQVTRLALADQQAGSPAVSGQEGGTLAGWQD